jgi:hypothetical protein
MGFSASIFLIAVGAILAFAVEASVEGLNIDTVGWILMGVGVIGLLLSIVAWDSWGGFSRGGSVAHRETVVERDRYVQ